LSAPQFYTIGVYGWTPEQFFDSLRLAGIDTFCDIRRRRGVRGSEYSFANATRLQESLESMGVRYFHFLDLSPSLELRQKQYDADKQEHIAKRKRTGLGQVFIDGYRDVLDAVDVASFVDALGPDASRVVLMCVEKEPAACHRSLLADKLEQDLGMTVKHLVP